jgi:DNA ligase (NAD+)
MILAKRTIMESMVKGCGGSIAGSVNNKLDYLVAGNDKIGKSSKWKKATEIGVKIITEEEFLDMVK